MAGPSTDSRLGLGLDHVRPRRPPTPLKTGLCVTTRAPLGNALSRSSASNEIAESGAKAALSRRFSFRPVPLARNRPGGHHPANPGVLHGRQVHVGHELQAQGLLILRSATGEVTQPTPGEFARNPLQAGLGPQVRRSAVTRRLSSPLYSPDSPFSRSVGLAGSGSSSYTKSETRTSGSRVGLAETHWVCLISLASRRGGSSTGPGAPGESGVTDEINRLTPTNLHRSLPSTDHCCPLSEPRRASRRAGTGRAGVLYPLNVVSGVFGTTPFRYPGTGNPRKGFLPISGTGSTLGPSNETDSTPGKGDRRLLHGERSNAPRPHFLSLALRKRKG